MSNVIKAVVPEQEQRSIKHKMVKINASTQMDFPPELKEVARRITADAEKEAEAIREQVEKEAQEFQEQVKQKQLELEQEKERVLAEARASGKQQGFEEGKQEALNTYQTQLVEAQKIIQSAEVDYHKYLEQAEKEILDLALTISETIIDTEIEADPSKWNSLVKKAIRQVRDQEPIKLILNPRWYVHVIENREEIESITHHHRVLIIPDDQLAENDCFIETSFGRIEAGIDNQLKKIRSKLYELLEDPSNEKGLSTHQ
ncbi:flagellar assembly protein FliH [Pullulanibacillus pueri]|uniref:Flagellar assembly protein FliH n=1 Tax=Pullulanibacillus pueri TaxID=1437324 RepID=A0A8J3EMW4_9BACL|nr:flagellar assembly protein FliH [Pullulanibacillus pueri]MBM7682476.1 flagellar assembly protein FliH [Pullulanibacillus pueri]GGH82246.1 flagellar assembly protein FliH [Pullulanibacillus pueri]